jgi:hypothetical protein
VCLRTSARKACLHRTPPAAPVPPCRSGAAAGCLDGGDIIATSRPMVDSIRDTGRVVVMGDALTGFGMRSPVAVRRLAPWPRAPALVRLPKCTKSSPGMPTDNVLTLRCPAAFKRSAIIAVLHTIPSIAAIATNGDSRSVTLQARPLVILKPIDGVTRHWRTCRDSGRRQTEYSSPEH